MSFLDALFGPATALKTTGADVNVSDADPPLEGQILVAIDNEHAHWQDPETVGNDTVARAAAAAAQSTANSAATAAATAQSTANTANSAAATAQTTANAAGTAAAAAQTTANAAVPKTLFDANTILAATTDDTPAALTVAASTVLGRKASGGIAAMSPTETKVVLSLDNVTNDAQTKAAISTAYSAKSPVAGADLVYIGDSAASFALKKATLTDLASLLSQSTGNPFIDVPSSPNAFDDEFNSGSADLSTRGWTVKTTGGTTLTYGGDIVPWDTTGPTGNTYRARIRGTWLEIQIPVNTGVFIFKSISLSAGDTYYARVGSNYRLDSSGSANFQEVGLYGNNAGTPDSANNRVYVSIYETSTAMNMDMARTTAGSTVGTSRGIYVSHDIRGVRYASGTSYFPFSADSANCQSLNVNPAGSMAAGSVAYFAIGFTAPAGGTTPGIHMVDYARKKTSNDWIGG